MNIRTKKLMSLFLAVSMVFSMNTIAFGGAKKTVNISAQGKAGIDEIYDHFEFDKEGNPLTKVTYAESKTAKGKVKPKNVATIEHTDNPVSWNNCEEGRGLMETVLSGYEASDNDEYLNNSKTLSANISIGGPFGSYNGYMYATCDLGDGIVLLARYGFGTLGCVEGYDDYIPGTDGQFNAIPVREFDGRSIAFNKSGLYKGTKSKKECLNVVAAVVKYDAATGTVTELDGTEVASVKFSSKDGAKNACVSGESIPVEKKYKRSADSEEQPAKVQEYKKLGSATIPTFTVKVKGKGDAKPYVKKMNDAFTQNPFAFAIRQRTIIAYNSYEAVAYAAKLNKEAVTDFEGKVISSPTNAEPEYLERYVALKTGASAYDNGYENESLAKAPTELNNDLYLQKFKGDKSKLAIGVRVGNSSKGFNKIAYAALKPGTDYEIKSGKLAGEKEVFYVEFKEGGNVAYSMITGYRGGESHEYTYRDYSGETEVHPDGTTWERFDDITYTSSSSYTINNLAPFKFKIAFRQSPKDKKLVRTGGVYKEDNVGFVFSED